MKCDTQKLIEASDLLTVPEIAEIFGVSKGAIYQRTMTGDLEITKKPGVKTGFVKKSNVIDAFGIDYEDLLDSETSLTPTQPPQQITTTTVVLPATVTQGVHVVFDARGEPSELWIGSPGLGKKYSIQCE